MKHALWAAEPGRKLLLLGNEAIVRGALEAGVGFVSTYPGTPSSEIGDTFNELAADAGVIFEYSTNEKVALETAAAPAAAGVRCLVAMKHVGLNVAADPLMTLAYVGVRGGLVIVSADDPACHSSQNEQDNRYFARLANLPMLEPATPADAHAMTRYAFELSERVELPVILRTTTRVAHTRGVVTTGILAEPVSRGRFVKEPTRWVSVPATARRRHPVLLAQFAKADDLLSESPFHTEEGTGTELGVVTSGVASCYVHDVVRDLGVLDRVRVLKLATTHPIPRARCAEFLARFDRVLVAEELEPFLEDQLKALAHDTGATTRILGKGDGRFSRLGEFGPDVVRAVLRDLLSIDEPARETLALAAAPARPPILCASCPHRSTYLLVKMALGDDTVYMTDIGCYTLGFAPPLSMGDFCLCMGSSITKASGLSAVTDQRVAAFIGDSTFFHSGVTGLINAVHNRRSFLLVIMDNGTTGMTGHQPHPGAQIDTAGSRDVAMEDLIRAAGVEHLAVIDPSDFHASLETLNDFRDRPGLRVVIARSPCPLYARKTLGVRRAGLKYTIDHDRCRTCGREGDGLYCGMAPSKASELERAARRITAEGPTLTEMLTDCAAKMEHAPCQEACPAGICVQGYVNRVAAGEYDRALELIRRRVPLPGVLGRVCERPCEGVCVYGDAGDPIEINRLKRFVTDRETPEQRASYARSLKERIVPQGRAVAVVGSGPAGLACAYDLTLRGYTVTVFEAEKVLGGIPGWAVPRYRLPREVLDRDLELFHALGVEFRTGVTVGRDIRVSELLDGGFAAVFLGIGARLGAPLGVPGENLAGVEDALAFLRRVNLDIDRRVGRRVTVIGGGNSAMDAARVALRLGAESVRVVYRRGPEEMPADPQEVREAEEEGVTFVFLRAPKSVEGDGAARALRCAITLLGEPDDGGRRGVTITDGEESFETDHVIVAVGQRLDPATRAAEPGFFSVNRRGYLEAGEFGATADGRVFAGGDAVTGPATIVEAIAAGKRAAYAIDLSLTGDKTRVLKEPAPRAAHTHEERYRPRALRARPAIEAQRRDPAARRADFGEAEITYTEDQARAEARRCLACGLCASCRNCLDHFGCPAFYEEDSRVFIDPALCDGCGVCVQVCPNGAIGAMEATA